MKNILTIILALIGIGAFKSAPTDYVTQDELNIAISNCIVEEDLEDFVTVDDTQFLQKQIYSINDRLGNATTTMDIIILQNKVGILELRIK